RRSRTRASPAFLSIALSTVGPSRDYSSGSPHAASERWPIERTERGHICRVVASTDSGAPVPLDPHEAEYRARLQSALGSDYALAGLIGLGGMGAVYVARDRKLDRDVAVKTLRADVFPSRLVIERFEREAKALAKLRHPNIL